MNGKKLYSLKHKKSKTLTELFLYDNTNRPVYKTPKTKQIPSVTGYFPEDFSLNIYKSTSLYKKRYQIEPIRLKQELKLIKTKKKSMKYENTINKIKNYLTESSFSTDLFRLIKSNKIDRFAKRYLEHKNYLNVYKNKKMSRIFLSHGNNSIENNNQIDEDKIGKIDNIKLKRTFHLNEFKKLDNRYLILQNIIGQNSENKIKNKNIKSPISFINKFDENIKVDEKQKLMKRTRSYKNLKKNYLFDSLKFYNNPKNSDKYKNIKNKNYNFSGMYLFLDKNQNVKLFSPIKYNLNLINKLKTKRKLKFSIYDPNDNDVKLFKKFEKRQKSLNPNEKSTDFNSNN